MNIQAQIDQYKSGLAAVEAFAKHFIPLLPEGFPGAPVISSYAGPSFRICAPRAYQSPENSDKLLAACGYIFGRDGWTETLGFSKEAYDWHREIDGVQVVIESARMVPLERDNRPVPPNLFPVLLADVQAA